MKKKKRDVTADGVNFVALKTLLREPAFFRVY